MPRHPTTKICTRCKKNCSIDEFPTYISRTRGFRRRSNCKSCETERCRLYNNVHRERKREGYKRLRDKKYAIGGDALIYYVFSQRLGALRVTTRQLNLPPITITSKYLLEQFKAQNGCCYYSGEPLLYGHRKGVQQPNSLSIDRKNPKLGYVVGNVVLCTHFINTMKGSCSVDEFKSMLALLHSKMASWS